MAEITENGGEDSVYYANATEESADMLGAKRAAGTGIRSGGVAVTARLTAVFAAE